MARVPFQRVQHTKYLSVCISGGAAAVSVCTQRIQGLYLLGSCYTDCSSQLSTETAPSTEALRGQKIGELVVGARMSGQSHRCKKVC